MRKLGTAVTVSALALGLMSSMAWAGSIKPQAAGDDELAPTGKGWGVHAPGGHAKPGGGGAGNGIFYHGGPVMSSGATIHYIWYQCSTPWSSTDQSILDNLASNLGALSYFKHQHDVRTPTAARSQSGHEGRRRHRQLLARHEPLRRPDPAGRRLAQPDRHQRHLSGADVR